MSHRKRTTTKEQLTTFLFQEAPAVRRILEVPANKSLRESNHARQGYRISLN